MKQVIVLTCGSASLVGKEGLPCKLDADGTAILCTAAADEAVGVIERGAAIGAPVDVVVFGQTGVVVSGVVKRGQVVTVAAAGTSCTGGKVDGSTFMGAFLQNGAAGDTVAAFINQPTKHKA